MKTQTINGIKCSQPFAIKKVAQSNKMLSFMFDKHPGISAAYDALQPVQITLTPKDIKNGVPKDPTKCAFAKGSCVTLNADDAYVGTRMACLKFGDKLVRFRIPESVNKELFCFDRHRKCKASKTYRFSAIPPHRRLGRPYHTPKKNGKKNLKRRNGGFVKKHMAEGIRPIG